MTNKMWRNKTITIFLLRETTKLAVTHEIGCDITWNDKMFEFKFLRQFKTCFIFYFSMQRIIRNSTSIWGAILRFSISEFFECVKQFEIANFVFIFLFSIYFFSSQISFASLLLFCRWRYALKECWAGKIGLKPGQNDQIYLWLSELLNLLKNNFMCFSSHFENDQNFLEITRGKHALLTQNWFLLF